jgi:hypothetical protein
LAQGICTLFPPSGPRFVDVFAGRGNISWAAMTLLNYKRHWINALGTRDFFDGIKYGIYAVPERDPKVYHTMKERMKNPPEHRKVPMSSLRILHPEVVRGIDADGLVKLKFPKSHHKAQPAQLLEGFLTFSGGTYAQAGARVGPGGSASKGYERRLALAGKLMYEKRPRLTALDYRKVLAECKSTDMVYLDPPYRGANVKSYDDRTIDFIGLVKTLLHAPYKWVLSEYDNAVYKPLTKKFGPPLKIPVQRTMTNARKSRINTGEKKRKIVIECLWKNF